MQKHYTPGLLIIGIACLMIVNFTCIQAQVNGKKSEEQNNLLFQRSSSALSNKKTEPSNAARSGTQEQLRIGLYFLLNGEDRVADGVTVLFNNNYSAAVDGDDAEQLANFNEDLAIKREGKLLSKEGRPLIDNRDTIFLNIQRMLTQVYKFKFNPVGFNAPGLQAYLRDNFANIETPISLAANSEINFFRYRRCGNLCSQPFQRTI